MTGPMAGRSKGEVFEVVTAACKLTGSDGQSYCAVAHEALYDSSPAQTESLLSTHQCKRISANRIDDNTVNEFDIYGNPGTQTCVFGSHSLPMYFDGQVCFFKVEPIDKNGLDTLPRVVLTEEGVEYDPCYRRRHTSRRLGPSNFSSEDWQRQLGYIPKNVVKKTLEATTQLVPTVEAETREIMRDHRATRLPSLKCTRLRDEVCWDTFFSSVESVRGYTCFNLFGLREGGLDKVYLMRRKSQALSTLQQFVAEVGAPKCLLSDNAHELKSKAVTKYLNSIAVPTRKTEPHHPNQNLAERRGGSIKASVVHLLLMTGAPLTFWCYALEYIASVRECIARRSLGWRSPYEVTWGITPDISVFRFVFWEPLWYYDPRRGFPKSKMRKGRFLGIATNVGDAFCFLVLVEPDTPGGRPQVLARSVVRRRTPDEDERLPPVCERLNSGRLIFYKSDGVTPLDDVVDDDLELSAAEAQVVAASEATGDHSLDDAPTSHTHGTLVDTLNQVAGPLPIGLRFERNADRLDIDSSAGTERDPNSSLESAKASDTSPTIPEENMLEPDPVEPMLDDSSDIINVPESASPVSPLPIHQTDLDGDGRSSGVSSGHPREFNSRTLRDRVPIPVTQDDDNDSVGVEATDDAIAHVEGIVDPNMEQEMMETIVGHEWKDGILHFDILWSTDEVSTLPFSVCKHDFPFEIATYIRDKKVGTRDGRYLRGPEQRWARSVIRQARQVFRRFRRKFGDMLITPEDLEEDTTVPHYQVETADLTLPKHLRTVVTVRRVKRRTSSKKRKKPGRIRRPIEMKYGIAVPSSVEHAYALDKANGDTYWTDAIEKEIKSLLMMECFDFQGPDFKPSSDFQFAPLRMIFEVKQDQRRKARLVIFGHVVDSRGVSARSSVVKGISVRLLDLIAHRDRLDIMHGDISNAFISAPCQEKIYTRAGPEFGERSGSILILKKALYGLRTSSKAFRGCFADFLRTLGFFPTRYDRDVWMRLREENDGYDYICTHVDDFKVVARDCERWIEAIKEVFTVKTAERPQYYLGNDYTWDEKLKCWRINCVTYLTECVRRVEAIPGIGKLHVKHTPMPEGEHPELDKSPLLDETGIRLYQMMIGMAQWACTVGRLDISFAVSSLSRFNSAPREGHFALVVHLFCYLKHHKAKSLVLDAEDLEIPDELNTTSFHPEFLEDYPDAKEEAAEDMSIYPTPFGRELNLSIFFDADHAHDAVTRRSITGIIILVGNAPVQWSSKRQGCIATSTYTAEFVAMRQAVEEAIALRYMLRCLGVPVTKPTNLYGDNLGSIQSATVPDSEMKKKHVAISYHFVREAIAAKIVNVIKVDTEDNFSDVCTKALGRTLFWSLVWRLMQ